MDAYGLLSTGFNAPTFDVIQADIVTDLQSAFGASIPVGVRSLFGNLKSIFAERELRLWNLGQAVDDAMNPQTAVGAAQEDISAITGTGPCTVRRRFVDGHRDADRHGVDACASQLAREDRQHGRGIRDAGRCDDRRARGVGRHDRVRRRRSPVERRQCVRLHRAGNLRR